MIIIGSLINNHTLEILLLLITLLFTFYVLGRIIQETFSFKKSNHFLSIPIGLVIYLIFNHIMYFAIIFFQLKIEFLKGFDFLKEFSLFCIIAVSYKIWIPKNKNFYTSIYITSFTAISIIIPIIIFRVSDFYLPSFSPINSDFSDSITNIGELGYFHNISVNEDDFAWFQKTFEKYESTYYWIWLTSSWSSLSTEVVIDDLITPIVFIVVSLTVSGSLVDSERSIFSMTLSFLMSTLFILFLGLIGPYNSSFYSLAMIISIVMMLFNYVSQAKPPEKTITILLFSTLTFLTIDDNGLMLIIFYGLMLVIASIIKKGKIIFNTINYLLIVFVIIFICSILFLLENIEFLSEFILFIFIIVSIFSILFFPLYSLEYNGNRRNDLVSLEENLNKKFFKIVIITTIISITLSIFVGLLYNIDQIALYKDFFTSINIFNDSYWLGILIYFLLIILPLIIILIFKYFKIEFNILNLFVFINLIFNPVFVMIFMNIFDFKIDIQIIFLPSILLIVLEFLSLIVKKVPSKFKI